MNSDFKELLTILNACQVSYLVVGGYAYIHYAEPRYTKDIDLWIQPTRENAIRLRQALLEFGGWVEGMTLEHFTTERTLFQIGLPPCRVDFLTSIPGLEFGPAFEARKVVDIDGLALPLISLTDLITAKRASGREQDLRDVAGLERVVWEETRGDL
ncbi:nucleotidyltransferase [bacterium]|nr:nucleotidyltransferase [bacterium]